MNRENNIKMSSNKSFGIVFFVVFLIISLFPLLKGEKVIFSLLIISIVFLTLGLLNSKILFPINKLWFKFGLILGSIISPIIMGIIYFFILTPTGLLMRLFGKDVLNLKWNKNNTYWIDKTGPKSKMKNQF